MDNLKKALESIVNGSDNFCCLCFNICDARDLICSIDEASIVINNNNENVVMSDLILTTLGSNVSIIYTIIHEKQTKFKVEI